MLHIRTANKGILVSSILCFWLAKTDLFEFSLRRYSSATAERVCSGKYGYHNASVVIGQGNADQAAKRHDGIPCCGNFFQHDDPRWPTKCEYCEDYTFTDDDEWQYNAHHLLVRVDTGEHFTQHNAPVGAMFDCDWLEGADGYKRIDGITLMVKTPDGEWCVDGPSYSGGKVNGPGWTRTGTVPKITASPSILMTNYHGWLREGFLVD